MTDLDANADEPRVPRRNVLSPIEMMGRTLVSQRVDLGDEIACLDALKNRFSASEISFGFHHAVDRAREIKAHVDLPVVAVQDLAVAMMVFLVLTFVAVPARAAGLVERAEPGLVEIWWLILGLGLICAILGAGMLIWPVGKGRS